MRAPAPSLAFNQLQAEGAEETVMRIRNVICSFALLTLASGSGIAATADPNNDFDCATAFQFAHRMAVAKQLVDAHGGVIWCESTPGSGATFFFHLGR